VERISKSDEEKRHPEVAATWTDVAVSQHSENDLAELLIDEVTQLPTVPLLLEKMRQIVSYRGQMGLLYVGIVPCSIIECMYGWETFDLVFREIARCLIEVKENYLRQQDVVGEVTINGNALVLVLSPPRTKKRIDYEDLKLLRQRVYDRLDNCLDDRLDFNLYDKFGCNIGCAILEDNPTAKFERNLYRALEEAYTDYILEKERDKKRRIRTLQDIVRQHKIYTLYQPIVDLHHKEIIGYEALSRGLEAGFEDPDCLFRIASEADSIWGLERLCRSRALEGARQLQNGKLLFINVEPEAIYDPNFHGSEIINQLAAVGLSPDRVVIELTEHTDVRNFHDFRETLQIFKTLGFIIAIDDVGSGYAGLQSIAELHPDFIKVDMCLTRNVHLDPVKQELFTTVSHFCNNIGIKMIVEGVEKEAELIALKRLGIRFAQGFHFALPGNPFPEVDFTIF
jgi:EAL domain-containing protein (putative c-di-GMP-specific phosphodiesterase class I)